MKILTKSVNSLVPYALNNRKHSEKQTDRIASSIAEFGFNQPIVVDNNDVVIVGHGRLEAAKKLGLKEVPVVEVGELTDAQIKAYRILDNKLQNDSEWDIDNLQLEFGVLTDLDFDLSFGGLDELSSLFDKEEPEVAEDDFEPEEVDEPFIKQGDLIELGRHRVLCGDSTSSEDVALLLAENTPEIMVTDPPYGVEYNPTWREEYDGGARTSGKVENDDKADWVEAWQLFKGQLAYVWHAGRFSDVVADGLTQCGFEVRNLIIWAKQRHTFGRGHYHHKHEPCWYVVRAGFTALWGGDRTQTTLWEINSNRKNDTGHGTQKPIECMARPMKNHNVKSVYDPFLGSGTTLVAAEQLGRTCYGMELSPKYCQVILERYKKYCEDNNKAFECKINGEEYKA